MFDPERRSLLAAAVGAVTSLAGCSSGSSSETATTSSPTTTESPERTATTDATATETETSVELDGSVPSSPVRSGESVEVAVTVTNHGADDEVALTGRFDGETVFTDSVEVPGGESATVTVETPPLDRYGSVEVSVNEVRRRASTALDRARRSGSTPASIGVRSSPGGAATPTTPS